MAWIRVKGGNVITERVSQQEKTMIAFLTGLSNFGDKSGEGNS
jgi:hypothetical protein